MFSHSLTEGGRGEGEGEGTGEEEERGRGEEVGVLISEREMSYGLCERR